MMFGYLLLGIGIVIMLINVIRFYSEMKGESIWTKLINSTDFFNGIDSLFYLGFLIMLAGLLMILKIL